MTAEFRLLGRVEAEVGGRLVNVGHPRQRSVLAVLLIEANRPVSVDQLVDRVWGGRPPQRGPGTVYSYLSRLRQSLVGAGGVRLARQAGGYVLAVDPMAVDLHRFRRLVAAARAAGDGAAAALFDQALALWRGEPFADLDTAWLNRERHAAVAERLAAELDRNDLALAQGRHAELLAGLSAGTTAHPLDERLAGQFMLALYRNGRQADALVHYERVRRQLADELGADPGPPLRRLHRQILTGDPVLAGNIDTGSASQSRRPAAGPIRSAVPQQLPALPSSFTGRARQLAELSRAMDVRPDRAGTVVISAIGGLGGIGKTWLTLHWAHENLHRFPDGQLYVNLRGFDPASDPLPAEVAVRAFLDALGVPATAVPVDLDAQAALFRSLMAGRRMLVVLDNARDTAQVVPLLPGSATGTVLVTSRSTLAGLVTAHGARPLVLDVLPEPEARQLLTGQLGADRVVAEPDAVAALVGHCAGLPLALGVAAARATIHPELPLAVLAKELRDASTRLDALDAGELAVNLRAVLACSNGALGGDASRVFAELGLAPGPDIGLPAVASLTALPPARARTLLAELTNAHLVHEHAPGRYRMHDLVRLYAGELARDPADRWRAATHRVLDHYLHTAYDANEVLNPYRDSPALPPAQPGVAAEAVADHPAALAWFTVEHPVLVAAVGHAASTGFDRHAWQLAWNCSTFFDRRGHWLDQAATQRTALSAARRLADPRAQAYAHRGLGLAGIWLRGFQDAHTHLRHALDLSGAAGDPTERAHVHRSLARLFAHQDRFREALAHDQQALELYRASGDQTGQARTLNAVGWHLAHLGQHRAALDYCQRALTLYQQAGDRHGQALTWDSLGYARRQLGHHRPAIDCYQRALNLLCELGDRYYQGVVRACLGDCYHAVGAVGAARGSWQDAVQIFDELGHPAADRVRARLAPA